MDSYSPNTASAPYKFQRTPEQIQEVRDKYGDLPEGDMFAYDLPSVLKWGSPWWRVHDILYQRNSKVESLRDEDDLLVWKAMLVTLAHTVNRYNLPRRMSGYTVKKQWKHDLFVDAAAVLWQIIRSARGKLLALHGTIRMAIMKAARDSRVHKIPSNFDLDKFHQVFGMHRLVVPDPADWFAECMDEQDLRESADRIAGDRVRSRIAIMSPKLQEAALKTLNGQPCKSKTARDLVRVIRLKTAHELRERAKREV